MKFKHHESDVRTATVAESGATLVVNYVDESGKDRKKSFKGKGKSASAMAGIWLKALRFLAKEGFSFGRSDSVDWLAFLDGPYFGQQAFCVDPETGNVWQVEGDPPELRCIEPNGTQSVHALGPGVNARNIQFANGELLLLLGAFHKAGDGVPDWKVPASGQFAANVARMKDGELTLVTSVPYASADECLDDICIADDCWLGPHADGAALYREDDNVIETYPVHPTTHNYPRGAVSPDGNTVALTASEHTVRIIDRSNGNEQSVGGFKQVFRLRADNDGSVFVFGHGPKGWGIYRVEGDAVEQISKDVHGEPSPDGRFVLSVKEGVYAVEQPGEKARKTKLSMLIGREGRSVFVDTNHVIIRMRSATPTVSVRLG